MERSCSLPEMHCQAKTMLIRTHESIAIPAYLFVHVSFQLHIPTNGNWVLPVYQIAINFHIQNKQNGKSSSRLAPPPPIQVRLVRVSHTHAVRLVLRVQSMVYSRKTDVILSPEDI